jgi:hypothetical protein
MFDDMFVPNKRYARAVFPSHATNPSRYLDTCAIDPSWYLDTCATNPMLATREAHYAREIQGRGIDP